MLWKDIWIHIKDDRKTEIDSREIVIKRKLFKLVNLVNDNALREKYIEYSMEKKFRYEWKKIYSI